MFYQRGTNSKGGVVVAVGKHLKATRIDIKTENTVIVDIDGLAEPIRVIGVYWPHCQNRNMDELSPFVTGRTVLAGDLNASVYEWNSPSTDARGLLLKRWIEKMNLFFIPGTKNSSKRSARHIDLIFTNVVDAKAETMLEGSSDHWPMVMKSDQIVIQINGHFPVLNLIININKPADILEGICECVAGSGPRAACKHLAALCFALLDYDQNKLYEACTERLQEWHQPTRRSTNPIPLLDIRFTCLQHNRVEEKMSKYWKFLEEYSYVPAATTTLRRLLLKYDQQSTAAACFLLPQQTTTSFITLPARVVDQVSILSGYSID
ncbi:unnamed protein product [Rotaria sp. Silwood1]|nr:unnamed protein product [Rotaria sp. Silwood1]